jgi:hypothetical protein
MRKALQPNQSQKRPDQWIKRCPESLEKHRLYVGSSSASQVHHPPHYHHHAEQWDFGTMELWDYGTI